jgi:uncharacterized alkaline shock family protein YloU
MIQPTAPAGTIQVSTRAIASIVMRSVAEVDNVVGLVAPDAQPYAPALTPAAAQRGMSIHQRGASTTVEVFVLLVSGVDIRAVAYALEQHIRHQLAFALGSEPQVHIRLKGLRHISQREAATRSAGQPG